MNGPSYDWLQKIAPLLATVPDPNAPPQDFGAAAANGAPLPVPPQPRAPQNSPLGQALVGAVDSPDRASLVTLANALGTQSATPRGPDPTVRLPDGMSAPARDVVGVSPSSQSAPIGQPPPPTAAQPVSAQPALPPDVQFRATGGGSAPAREAAIRGPQQQGALMAAAEAPGPGIERSDFRNHLTAQHEADVYAQQAEAAMERQAAIERTIERRQQEMMAAQQDYQDKVNQVGQMHLDSSRWWGNKSTGEKIGATILTVLGGIGSAFNGGVNRAAEVIDKKINQDIDAQKFDYQAGLDSAKGAQNSFAMLMDRYHNEDAATAAARAAALDFASAKVSQLGADWKGTNSANDADALRALIEQKRQETIASGLKFVPASVAAPRYQLSVRGQVLPGTVSEAQAQNIAIEHGVKPSERVDEEMVKGGIQMSVEDRKLQAEARRKATENGVVLPTGETVNAQNPGTAKELRDSVVSLNKTAALVKEAKDIRSASAFRVSPEARGRLSQIQAELLTDFGVQHQLGALSDKDYEIAQQGTANLFDITSPVEAQLDAIHSRANQKVRSLVKTLPGGAENAPRASGTMPASFTAHGK